MQVRDITNPAQLRSLLDWVLRQVSDNTGVVTIANNTTQTVVQHGKVTPNSVVTLSALTANAALMQSTVWVTAANGSFTINHSSSAAADRKFAYSIFGV